uniref:Uncharacterized protein n=1 Tax=Arundo donax TaxID=35708 RepID=A0A0A9BHY9_ARUDO
MFHTTMMTISIQRGVDYLALLSSPC